MANWSRAMCQGVLNRTVRMLAPSPLGSHFFSASSSLLAEIEIDCDIYETYTPSDRLLSWNYGNNKLADHVNFTTLTTI
ncbi:hypothetical protein KIN20_013449 [Parelaphostrongylus tenuis]|uniref:Uncharacterized protein n=1 Tax=Parelaphostrongylus tenuis TaxID=148309 RepID=A0AAD5MFM1_PARTN|nr:hypothetical protein KIN20_013449 [Parelaphostrongylus tenuis]